MGEGKNTSPFAALKHGNYRLFFTGQVFSLTGGWMQRMAMSWLVLRTTESAANVGLMELLNQAPVFIIGLFSGVIVDRFSTRVVLMATQALALLQTLVLAVLVYRGAADFSVLLLLSLFLGVVNALDQPARQACVPQTLTDKRVLASALSLNSVVFNAARIVGPSLAGIVIHGWGELGCFLIAAVTFVASLLALYRLSLPERMMVEAQTASVAASIRAGFSYVGRERCIRTMLVIFFLLNFFLTPYVVLLPVYAWGVLKGGSQLLGILLGAMGTGAICGVIFLAARVPLQNIPNYMSRSLLCAGTAFLAFSQSAWTPLSIICLIVFGFAFISTAIANNTLIQALVDDEYRGRVMSLFVMGTLGFGPIGCLAAGKAADIFGGEIAAAACAAGAILTGTALFRLRKSLTFETGIILSRKGL